MTQTDYLLVLASIVIGLALAELLRGLAQLLRDWSSSKGYWIHALVVVNIFLFLLQFWWANWSWRNVQWTQVGMLVLVLGVIALYLVSHLVFPDRLTGMDLRSYYYAHCAHIWSMIAVYMLVGLVAPRVILEMPWRFDVHAAQQLLGAGVATILAISKRHWAHGILVTFMFAVNVIFFFA